MKERNFVNLGMKVDYIVNSIFKSMTYILMDDDIDGCWLIDCGDVDKVVEIIGDLIIEGVLLTHAHFDHIYGLNRLMEISPDTLIYTNSCGMETLLNPRWNFSHYHESVSDFVFDKPQNVRLLDGLKSFSLVDGISVGVLKTPGHEPSCLSYFIGEYVFTGDAYIPGIRTITTFPRSDKKLAAESLALLRNLESNGYKVLPGHWHESIDDLIC